MRRGEGLAVVVLWGKMGLRWRGMCPPRGSLQEAMRLISSLAGVPKPLVYAERRHLLKDSALDYSRKSEFPFFYYYCRGGELEAKPT